MTQTAITRQLLIDLAGATAFARGEVYAQDGHVDLHARRERSAGATVSGTWPYTVALHWEDGELVGECDCPVGMQDEFCKHQVATALCWAGLADDAPAASPPPAASTRKRATKTARAAESDDTVVRRWLDGQSAEALRERVHELASRDKDQWHRLLAQARFALAAPEDLRQAVGDLIGRSRFLDYKASIAFTRRLDVLTGLLAERVASDPGAALDLADYALRRLLVLYARSDDSSGALGEAIAGVARLHRRAADRIRPGDAAFARAYLKLRLADDWRLVGPVEAYLDALGRAGLGAIEGQVQAALAKLPPKPDQRGSYASDPCLHERLVLEQLLEELARHGGDVDTLLAHKAKALHGAYDYLELARLCREHGRERAAIEWLERGLKAHSADQRLIVALAETWEREGFLEDAIDLRWRAFVQSPSPPAYLALRDTAVRIKAWDQWRDKALAHVDSIPRTTQSHRDSVRVVLHLAEGNLAAAWHIARQASLPPHIWAELAPQLEDTEPEGALRAYRTLVQAAVGQTDRRGYSEAVAWLRRMRPLYRRLGSEAAFADYLETLRQTHRAKRVLVGMLEAFAADQAAGSNV